MSRRGTAARIAVAAAAAVLALLAVEAGLRAWSVSRLTSAHAGLDFDVHSRSLYEFDEAFGYRYRSGVRDLAVRFSDGLPRQWWYAETNCRGTIGDPRLADPWHDAARRILVVGDSFTANPNYGGITWTDHLPALLDGQTALVNQARDGYGVLQMVELAAHLAPRLDPDLVLVAFIGDDLGRDRLWRFNAEIDGWPRVFATRRPIPELDWDRCADAALLIPSMTEAWARRAVAAGPPADPLAAGIVARFLELRDQNLAARRRAARTSGHSFLLSQLLHGDPLAAWRGPARLPRHHLSDLVRDAGFRRAMSVLERSRALVVFLHLPRHQELRAGTYLVSAHQRLLLENLDYDLASRPSMSLVPLLDLAGEPPEDLERLFMLPVDFHPSPAGARFYAEIVARALAGEGLLPTGSEEADSASGQ